MRTTLNYHCDTFRKCHYHWLKIYYNNFDCEFTPVQLKEANKILKESLIIRTPDLSYTFSL